MKSAWLVIGLALVASVVVVLAPRKKPVQVQIQPRYEQFSSLPQTMPTPPTAPSRPNPEFERQIAQLNQEVINLRQEVNSMKTKFTAIERAIRNMDREIWTLERDFDRRIRMLEMKIREYNLPETDSEWRPVQVPTPE
jgi:predicted RNase H-like nuclease (RuvC/YqgF family)